MKRTLTLALAFVLALGMIGGPALADNGYEFPSTNEQNREQGGPHVNFDDAGIGEVTLEFVMPHDYLACFEYRTDGDTSQAIDDEHFNPWLDDDLYPFFCIEDGTVTDAFEVDEYVEIRLAFGAERDWDFDWTTFEAAPPPPESLGAIQRDAQPSEVDNIRVSDEWWVVEHEVDAAEVEQIWWYEGGTFYDVTQPQEDRPVVSDLWIDERDAGNITVFYKMNDDEWLYLAPRFNGRGDLVQVNGIRP